MVQNLAMKPAPLVRGHSRFRLRVCLTEGGLRPFGWEVYDEEDGRNILRATRGFRTSAEAWESGSAVLDARRSE